jgi:hypothetical protein
MGRNDINDIFETGVDVKQDSAQVALAQAGTIPVNSTAGIHVNPGAAVTAIKLAAGLYDGQRYNVYNDDATATHTITFDVLANSRVLDGASCVIGVGSFKTFVWTKALNGGAGAWQHN